MTEPRTIAAGLTEAQKRFLQELPTYAVDSYPPRKALLGKGLAIIVRPPDGDLHATALGNAVRALLESDHEPER